MPLFSIIIPTFNAGEKLGLTLDSVRSQNFEDLEILVQDGGSTDGTRAFLETQDDVQWVSEKDSGIYDAMNKAVARSTGKFLIFLGAGDLLMPEALKQVAELLSQRREEIPLLLYGDVFWPALNRRYDGPSSDWKMTQRPPCHQAVFTDTRLFERWGGFDTRFKINADWEFLLRCFGDSNCEKRWVDVVVSHYEGGGVSTTTRDEEFLRALPSLVKKYLPARIYWLYRMRRAAPASLKKLAAPLLRRAKQVPDEQLRQQMPD